MPAEVRVFGRCLDPWHEATRRQVLEERLWRHDLLRQPDPRLLDLSFGKRAYRRPLTEAERTALTAPRDLADAPAPVRGDYTDWLDASFARAFGWSNAAGFVFSRQVTDAARAINRLLAGGETVYVGRDAYVAAGPGTLARVQQIAKTLGVNFTATGP